MTGLRLIALCFVLGLSTTAAFAGDLKAMPDAPALFEKAQNLGSVRVILKLDTEFVVEGSLSGSAAVANQRSQINRVQSDIASTLNASQLGSLKRFETVPYIGLELDKAGLENLLNNPLVIGVEEDGLSRATLLQSVPFINGDDVINSGSNGSGWTVAILDTGVRKTHVDLDSGKVVSEACYSSTVGSLNSFTVCPNGGQSQTSSGAGVNCGTAIDGCNHGTHVAGIAAGTYGGVAPGANLMAVQVFSRFTSSTQCGAGSTPCVLSYSTDQMLGLERVLSVHNASNGISIASANMSLGGGQFFSACDGNSLKSVIDNLRSAGIATVIASGNDGFNGSIGSPGCISSAITVGATLDNSNSISSYSNHASMIDVLAPGSNITSSIATSNSARDIYNGTSMATPHIAGAFAVYRHLKPSATVSQIESAMESTGVNISRSGVTKPRIDMLAAANVIEGSDLTISAFTVPNVIPNTNQTLNVTATVKNIGSDASDASIVSFYRSADNKITTSDILVGNESVPSLSSEEQSVKARSFSAPSSIGVNYLGACVGITNIKCSAATRIVVSDGPVEDAFENDDTGPAATPVNHGDVQFHSISPVGDKDWVTFTLREDKNRVVIRTNSAGFAGSTEVTVRDSGLNVIATASSGFADTPVLSDLAAGTYYVEVEEAGNNAQIEGYFLEAEIVEDDGFLLMVVPAIIASLSEPIPPQWGVGSNLCCTVGSMTFSATIGGSTRSSTLASCNSAGTFSGYVNISSGTKSISSRYSGPSCGTASFGTITTPFDNNYYYLVRAEFDGSPLVRIYRGALNKQSSKAKALDQSAQAADELELVETLQLDNLSSEGSLRSVEGKPRAAD